MDPNQSTTEPLENASGRIFVSGWFPDIAVLDSKSLAEIDLIPSDASEGCRLSIVENYENGNDESVVIAMSENCSDKVILFDTATRSPLNRLIGVAGEGLETLSNFSLSSNTVVVSGGSKDILAFDSVTGEVLCEISNPLHTTSRIRHFPEWAQGEVFVGGARSFRIGDLARYDLGQDCVRLGDYVGHDGPVGGIAACVSNALLLSGSTDGKLKLWNSGQTCVSTVKLRGACCSLEYIEDLHLICCGAVDGIEIFDIRRLSQRVMEPIGINLDEDPCDCHDMDIISTGLSTSPFLVVCGCDKAVSVINPSSGAVVSKQPCGARWNFVRGVRFQHSCDRTPIHRVVVSPSQFSFRFLSSLTNRELDQYRCDHMLCQDTSVILECHYLGDDDCDNLDDISCISLHDVRSSHSVVLTRQQEEKDNEHQQEPSLHRYEWMEPSCGLFIVKMDNGRITIGNLTIHVRSIESREELDWRVRRSVRPPCVLCETDCLEGNVVSSSVDVSKRLCFLSVELIYFPKKEEDEEDEGFLLPIHSCCLKLDDTVIAELSGHRRQSTTKGGFEPEPATYIFSLTDFNLRSGEYDIILNGIAVATAPLIIPLDPSLSRSQTKCVFPSKIIIVLGRLFLSIGGKRTDLPLRLISDGRIQVAWKPAVVGSYRIRGSVLFMIEDDEGEEEGEFLETLRTWTLFTAEVVESEDPMSDFLLDPSLLSIRRSEALGEGAFARVVRGSLCLTMSSAGGKMTAIETPVAVKLLPLSSMKQITRESVGREVRMLKEASHPNCLECYGCCFGESLDGVSEARVVTELCCDENLFEWLITQKHFFHADGCIRLPFILQIARCLHYLHSKQPTPIIHRDLKPENLLLSLDHRFVKVGDFGTSRHAGSLIHSFKGTSIYIPNRDFVTYPDKRTLDVYAFGLICYELWSSKRIYLIPEYVCLLEACDGDEVGFVQQIHLTLLRPSFDGIVVPVELKELIEECWANHPEDRPLFEEIVERLTALLPSDFPLLEDPRLDSHNGMSSLEEMFNALSDDSSPARSGPETEVFSPTTTPFQRQLTEARFGDLFPKLSSLDIDSLELLTIVLTDEEDLETKEEVLSQLFGTSTRERIRKKKLLMWLESL